MCHKLCFCIFTDESYKLEDDSLPKMTVLSIDDEKKQSLDQNFQITGTYYGLSGRTEKSNAFAVTKVVALFLFFYSNLDSSNDDENMETNSSIKSYDGSTDNLTLEEFAQYELGETKQVMYWIIMRSSITESSKMQRNLS